MDWRQMAGRPTVDAFQLDPWELLNSVWSGGMQVFTSGNDSAPGSQRGMGEKKWDGRIDPRRGWIIAVCWIGAACAEYVHIRSRFYATIAHSIVVALHLAHSTYIPLSGALGLYSTSLLLSYSAILS